ncbi:unnamed protein product [Malus baccata var. baccata]
MAFHEQFYRIEPEMTINDLVEVKQYEHEFTKDFMMRFRKTRMRCQFPVNQAQLISISQRALRLPLRNKFYDTLLLEEQQVKHTSKAPYFYKNKATIHRVEIEETRPEHEDGHDRDEIDPPKYQSYSFDLAKAPEIYEELVRARVILPDSTKKMPKPEKLRGKKYCKLHYTFNHSIANCVQFRDWIQDLIVKGKLFLDKPQAGMIIDTNPFPEAPINMVNLIWVEKPGSSFVAKEEGDRSQVAPTPPLK